MLYKIDDDYMSSMELKEMHSGAQPSCSSQAEPIELSHADSFDHCNDLDGLVLREDSFDCCQVILPDPTALSSPTTTTTSAVTTTATAGDGPMPFASHPINGSMTSTQATCRSEQLSPSPTFSHASSDAACHGSEQLGQQTQQERQQGQQTQQEQQQGQQEGQEVLSGEEDYGEEDQEGDGAQSDDSERFSDVGDPSATEVVFVKEGVAVWPSKHERIMGRLSLVKQHCVTFLAWLPYAHVAPAATNGAGRCENSSDRQGKSSGALSSNGSCSHARHSSGDSGDWQAEEGEEQVMQQQQEPLSDGAHAASATATAAGGRAGSNTSGSGGRTSSSRSGGSSSGSSPARPQHRQQQQQPQQSLHQAPSPEAVAAATAAAAAAAAHSSTGHTRSAGSTSTIGGASSPPSKRHQQAQGQQQEQQQGQGQQRQQQAHPAPPPASGDRTMYAIHPIPLSDIAAITRHTPLAGWHYIVVVLVSGLTLPPLFFHNGGVRELIRCLKSHAFLVRASQDPNTYLVNDTADPLQRSLTSLELSDILLGAPAPGASSTCAPASYSAAAGHLDVTSGYGYAGGYASVAGGGYPFGAGGFGSVGSGGYGNGGWDSSSEAAWRGLSQQLGDTLSKVTAFARESASSLISAVESWHNEQFLERAAGSGGFSGPEAADVLLGGEGSYFTHMQPMQPLLQGTSQSLQQPLDGGSAGAAGRLEAQVLQDLNDQLPTQQLPQQQRQQQQGTCVQQRQQGTCVEQLGSSSTTGSTTTGSTAAGPSRGHASSQQRPQQESEASTSVGTFELLDESACGQDRIALSRARVRPPPLSAEEMGTYFNAEGVMVDIAGFKERVFYSGIEPELRKEAWPFLLGVHPPGASAADRAKLAAQRRQRYAAIKAQWQSIGEDQARRFAKWRERKGRIEKDVRRTDRSHPFYSGKDQSPNLRMLRDILCSYAMFNFDLGYCQGMSDLASPLLYVCRDESEAFWCFAALMERLERNFHTDQNGMHAQLLALKRLVQVLDPQLHAFFDARDCTNYFFTFRWLLIHFKREFPFDEVLRLWEALWSASGHLTPHLHLYLAVAVLVHHRRAILADPHADFDCMLKLCVQLGGRLELDGMLRLAESLCVYAGEAGKECLAGLP